MPLGELREFEGMPNEFHVIATRSTLSMRIIETDSKYGTKLTTY
jgi:hypothetical protein